jgi:hypothetical protein
MDSVSPVAHKPPTGTADASRATGAQPLVRARVLKIEGRGARGLTRDLSAPVLVAVASYEWRK